MVPQEVREAVDFTLKLRKPELRARATGSTWFAGTFPALALKVLCPGSPVSPTQTWTPGPSIQDHIWVPPLQLGYSPNPMCARGLGILCHLFLKEGPPPTRIYPGTWVEAGPSAPSLWLPQLPPSPPTGPQAQEDD